MRNFILGFIVALILAGVGCGIYWLTRPREFGTLQVQTISQKGPAFVPIKGVEVDLRRNQPGPPQYKDDTDSNGLVLFEDIPVGRYAIFFNKGNFPKEFDYEVVPVFWATVKADQTVEKEIELQPR